MKNKNEILGFTIIIGIILFGSTALFLHAPIPQDLQYHLFKDTRTLFNIPNFWNVMSNLPFIIVGVMGLYWVHRAKTEKRSTGQRPAQFIFFLGVLLAGFGSGYYHLWPDNNLKQQ